MTAKTTKQPLSDNTRKLIIIIAIILVAVIVLSIALALILKEDVKVPADENTGSNGSSNLPIENGDFKYYSSADTGYPYTATDWTKYGYEDGTSFKSISTNEKAVMGIINLDEWDEVEADLKDAGVTLSQRIKVHKDLEDVGDDREENNVYMIHNRSAFAASILSDQVAVASLTSVKITVWINMSQVLSGNPVIMIQKSTPTFPTDEYRYAYNYQISRATGEDLDANGWQKEEFYVFNRETSTQYIKVSVGLGNAYLKDQVAQGTLFVDDITYDTLTSNEYRDRVDSDEGLGDTKNYQPYKILEDEEIEDETSYFEMVKEEGSEATLASYKSFEDYKAGEDGDAYLPFTKRDDFGPDDDPTGFTLYKITQEQDTDKVIAMRLSNPKDTLNPNSFKLSSSPIKKDHYHISFWVRVKQNDGHQATQANVYVQKQVNGKWEDIIINPSTPKVTTTFPSITTSQDVDTDANCGWVKYDIYLRPSTADDYNISILFVLGKKEGYTEKDKTNGMVPRGSLYVTSPAYEVISSKDYTNASTGNNVKKINLVGSSADPTITNGSFTDVNNVGNQPTSWTPVFAGDNAIYKDGGADTLDAEYKEVSKIAGSGIITDNTGVNDSQGHALQVTTNGTSFGYISNDITLSPRTVYVFSVMVKGPSTPNIYLVNPAKDTRENAIVARIEETSDMSELDKYFNYYSLSEGPTQSTDWSRYYIVYITEAESTTVRLALFSGAIDATNDDVKNAPENTVIYNNAELKVIGNYTLAEPENEDADKYDVSFTAQEGYEDAIEDLFGEGVEGKLNDESKIAQILDGNTLTQPDEKAWTEMRTIPENKDDDDKTDETTKTPSKVDWGLLMSVISSVLLVAALLIVFVIKVFQARKHNRVA